MGEAEAVADGALFDETTTTETVTEAVLPSESDAVQVALNVPVDVGV